jgi:methionine synthase II (cobalamin-independent)
LAVQFDIASDYIKNEAQRTPSYLSTLREDFHPPREDAMERYSAQYAGLIGKVPAAVETGLHICMGNINNKPVLAPQDMTVMVELANQIVSKANRPLQWLHFGCLPEWKDPAPYAALHKLDKNIAIYLGLVYPNDLEGAKQRIEAAKKQLGDIKFGIAPPCGLARTSEEGVDSVLGILKELS